MTSVSCAHQLSPAHYSSLAMGDSPLIDSLRRAAAEAPDDLPLLLHLCELLLDAGHGDEAVAHLASAIRLDPGSVAARSLMARALAPPAPTFGPPRVGPGAAVPDQAEVSGPAAERDPPGEPDPAAEFDWGRAEEDLGHPTPPMFVGGDHPAAASAAEVDRSTLRLADVGGMAEVKARLEAAFLAPMRNPELQRLYGKSLKGGLLLYGPPGCGKTFLARAVAGELGAGFITVSLADVIDMYIGQSERNLHDVFELARRSAPCVVFLDEVDALGQKRTQLRHSGMRSTVNQLLHELDGVGDDNQGVFVLAATNAPWDVDAALRRPGRLDRTLLVLPPDGPAREEILRYHLRDRPIAGIDLRKLAKRTEGFSGADLAHLCDSATEQALMDSARSGSARLIRMSDIEAALADVRPSTAPWFESARNVALFANEGGQYDDLLAYMKKNRLA